ncbi:MAG: acyl-CoA thioesterase [Acidobacteria bacterium]|uniref:Acyl-CoA thioesterase n=1 Tax=Candidatus Polarisedimenticola svalbardensis TaxID=2886004 RepID=A0A8J7C271_9BACT|nr:acyl-CoA thioesterase [Candidatus Polarisedimenticola svalbardensis]
MPAPTHRLSTRVRYPETDRMGVAHHSHFPVWFELGRTEWMREIGCPYGEMEDRDGVFFPVVDLGVRYLRPARYDQLLEIETRLASSEGVRVRFEYVIRDEGGSTLATGHTVHASVGRNGRPKRLPVDIRERLVAGMGMERER